MSNYGNQGGYGQQYGQYQQQGGYQNTYNDPNAYPQAPVYGQQQGGYGAQEFGPPRRQDSYGPPQTGGFQHGVQGQTYGQYDASNPQGHAGYYGEHQQPQYQQQQHQQQPQQQQQYGQGDAFAANQAYQQQMGSGTPSQPDASQHKFAPQSSDPNAPNYDPNAPAMTEQDRGLLGAIGGGFAGHHFGGKQGHGILGTVGGALLGSFAEDFLKKKKSDHSSGNSSWGGSKW